MLYVEFAGYSMLESPQITRSALDKAIELAEQAANKSPDDAMAQWVLGLAWTEVNFTAGTLGHDALPAIEKGIVANEKALAIDPQFLWAMRDLGNLYIWKASEEYERGVDPLPSVERALEQHARVVALAPASFEFHRRVACVALFTWMKVLIARGERPDAIALQAIAACEAGKAQSAPDHNFDEDMGRIYLEKARYELQAGLDPSTSIDRVLKAVEAANKIYACPALPDLRAIAYGRAARHAIAQGEDPEPWLRKARDALPRVTRPRRAYPRFVDEPIVVRAELDLIGIRWAMKNGKATPGHFEAGLEQVSPRSDAEPFDAARWRVTAEIHERRAAWLLERDRKPDEDIERGLAMAEKVLSRYARMAPALAVRGRLYLLRARAAREPSARAEAASLAKASLEAAFRANPLLERKHEQAMREAERLVDEKKSGAERSAQR
jgi:hypothetical protein